MISPLFGIPLSSILTTVVCRGTRFLGCERKRKTEYDEYGTKGTVKREINVPRHALSELDTSISSSEVAYPSSEGSSNRDANVGRKSRRR
jgi:hypothetical protein